MEESGSELCFISHPKHRMRASCGPNGSICMKDTWNGWEVWRFIKDEKSGNFHITSWTHDQKVLCSNSKGRVYSHDKTKLIEGDNLMQGEWKITIHPEKHGIVIKSVKHGRFLSFYDQNLCTSDGIKGDTDWHLEPAHRNQFFISSKCQDKRLSCTTKNNVTTHKNRKTWEKWVIEPTNKELGHFTIRSLEHGGYLDSSSKDNKLMVTDESKKQHWKIVPSPDEGVLVQSVKHGINLSCDENGMVVTGGDVRDNQIWTLEPIMTSTLSKKNILSWLGIGVATAAVTVAAPFAVMSIVGAYGFGASGIAAGSVGAGMMPAEAIAAGGSIAAGGTVATLQSIGAAGLGMAGASAAATVGAVAGGLTSCGVAAAAGGLKNEQERIRIENAGSHLPLCSWRMWQQLIHAQ